MNLGKEFLKIVSKMYNSKKVYICWPLTLTFHLGVSATRKSVHSTQSHPSMMHLLVASWIIQICNDVNLHNDVHDSQIFMEKKYFSFYN